MEPVEPYPQHRVGQPSIPEIYGSVSIIAWIDVSYWYLFHSGASAFISLWAPSCFNLIAIHITSEVSWTTFFCSFVRFAHLGLGLGAASVARTAVGVLGIELAGIAEDDMAKSDREFRCHFFLHFVLTLVVQHDTVHCFIIWYHWCNAILPLLMLHVVMHKSLVTSYIDLLQRTALLSLEGHVLTTPQCYSPYPPMLLTM